MFIVRCILYKDPKERCPIIYFYSGTDKEGVARYSTQKADAQRFPNRLEAERVMNPLLCKGALRSYKIEPEDEV